jgi:hypothetical protein
MTIQTIFKTAISLLVAVLGVAATTAHAESSCKGVNLSTVEWTTRYNVNAEYVRDDQINLEAEARQRHYLGPCDQYRVTRDGHGTLQLADASKANQLECLFDLMGVAQLSRAPIYESPGGTRVDTTHWGDEIRERCARVAEQTGDASLQKDLAVLDASLKARQSTDQ